jgi:hypothetical protein
MPAAAGEPVRLVITSQRRPSYGRDGGQREAQIVLPPAKPRTPEIDQVLALGYSQRNPSDDGFPKVGQLMDGR